MTEKEKPKEAEETKLNEVTDKKIIEAVKSKSNGRSSEILEHLNYVLQFEKVGSVYEAQHNSGAIGRVIQKQKLSDKLKVRQRTIDGKKQTYIVRVA